MHQADEARIFYSQSNWNRFDCIPLFVFRWCVPCFVWSLRCSMLGKLESAVYVCVAVLFYFNALIPYLVMSIFACILFALEDFSNEHSITVWSFKERVKGSSPNIIYHAIEKKTHILFFSHSSTTKIYQCTTGLSLNLCSKTLQRANCTRDFDNWCIECSRIWLKQRRIEWIKLFWEVFSLLHCFFPSWHEIYSSQSANNINNIHWMPYV